MTQNDISFYSAKKSAQDARLKRKETKRHDLAQEQLQSEANVASLIGAQARVASAQAAQQTANTNQKKYELDWEREYGWRYGTNPNEVFGEDGSYTYLNDDPSTGVVFPLYPVEGYSYRKYTQVPQSYINAVYAGQKTQRDIEKVKAERIKTIFDTAKIGGQTVEIIEELATGGKDK